MILYSKKSFLVLPSDAKMLLFLFHQHFIIWLIYKTTRFFFEYNKKVISPEFEINISYGFLCDLYKNNNVSQLLSIEDFNKITNDMCNEKSILQITNIFKKAVALDIKYIGTYKRLVFSDNPNEKYENVLQFKCGFENYNSVMSELYKNSFKEKGLINS